MSTTYNEGQEEAIPQQEENKYTKVSKLTVRPFNDDPCQSHLTFTIEGKDYTWSMSNYSLLTVIEDHLTKLGVVRAYNRILK